MSLILRTLSDADEDAFLAGVEAWGDESIWHSFVWREGMRFAEMLAILEREARGEELAPGRVPATMLYAFVDGAIVGRVSVRHRLNDALARVGGHFGYAVAPPFRRRGYATEMARHTLAFCRGEIGLREALATCDEQNAPSIRILERLGGTLLPRVPRHDGGLTRRYRFVLAG